MQNEVYIDIIKNINLLISKTGEVIRSEVIGKVGVKPECKFGIYGKLQLAGFNKKTGKN